MRADDNLDNRNKKKGTKKNSVNVPLSELGFKAKVYQGVETEYTRRRVRYKAARYGIENSRECFMGRLTFMIDPTTFTYDELADLPNFKGIKNNQWDKIKKIIFHSRDVLRCAICLQQNFKAPQMTSCGHVFCWHCIVMHHFKSLKANNCPVCNETYSIENIVTCQPIFDRSFKQIEENKIRFSLKYRKEGENQIYNYTTNEEDIDFAKIIKITSEKVTQIFEQERDEIMNYLHHCDVEQIKIWLEKTVSLAWEKIEKVNKNVAGREYRLHKNEKKVDGIIFSSISEKNNTVHFYQQASGKLIYLHPLCDKYLRKSGKELPLVLQQQILYWEEMEYNIEATKRYKCLNHITVNQEIDMIVISMKNLIAEDQNREFQKEFENTKIKKKDQMQREQKESVRLQIVYEQEKEYMQKLKKMEESEFYDIKVPTTINPSELEDINYFPSLIQTKSSPAEFHEYFPPSPKHKQIQKDKQKKPVLVLKEGDFPQLYPNILRIQSETLPTPFISAVQILPKKEELPKLPSKLPSKQQQFPDINNPVKKIEQPFKQSKKTRNKKQKFVNVTDQFFKRPQDDNNI